MKRAIINGVAYDRHTKAFKPNCTILWIDNRIQEVGQHVELPSDTEVIDGNGRFITPGLIDCFTQLGLKEVGIRWEGDDSYDVPSSSKHNLHVIDGIYPLDPSFKEARENGVTTVHVAPGSENVCAGTTAIIRTSGTVIDQMVIREAHGYVFSIGEVPKKMNRDSFQFPITRMGIAALLREALLRARYGRKDEPSSSPFSDAILHKVVAGEAPLFIRASRSDDIMTALRLQSEFSLDVTLVHAIEASLLLDELQNSKARVIGGPFFQDRSRYELIHLDPQTFVHIHQKQIPIAFMTDHPTSAIRNLILEARLAVRYGLEKEEAIHLLTQGAAELLRIDDQYGSIEQGKVADLVIWNDDPLELTSRVDQTIADGKDVFIRREGLR